MLFLSLSGCNIFNSVLGLRPHSCHELLRAALGFRWVAPIFFALSTDVLKYAVQFFGVLDSVCALSLCRFFRYIFGWLRGQGSHCGHQRVLKMMLGLWPHPTLHPCNIWMFGYTSASWRSLCTVAAISVLFSEIAGQTSVFLARSSVSGCHTVYFDCQFQCPPGLQ